MQTIIANSSTCSSIKVVLVLHGCTIGVSLRDSSPEVPFQVHILDDYFGTGGDGIAEISPAISYKIKHRRLVGCIHERGREKTRRSSFGKLLHFQKELLEQYTNMHLE